MLTRIGHVMICVPDLQQAIDAHTRIGFDIYPGGVHLGKGTHNAIAFHDEDDLELMSVRDRDEYLAASSSSSRAAEASVTSPCTATTSRAMWLPCRGAASTWGNRSKAGGVRRPDKSWGLQVLTVAPPTEPGPAAEALARRGPGPFQVLYRTSSMDAAARWMADHGVSPPARGIRNTGEQVMLVRAEDACGASIGFVGPA